MAFIAPTGRTGRIGFALNGNWLTEVAATDILVDYWASAKDATPHKNFPKGAGSLYKRAAVLEHVKADVDLKCQAFAIDGSNKILNTFCGMTAGSVSGAVDTTAYTHTYSPVDVPSQYLTVAYYGAGGTTGAEVVRSVFLNSMKVAAKDGDSPMTIDFKGIGDTVLRFPAQPTTNTPTTLAALTAPGQDAYEKKVVLIHGATVTGLNAGYFKIRRLGSFGFSTPVRTSPGGGNATMSTPVGSPTSQFPRAPETITVTFTAATTFTVAGTISGALGSGSTGVGYSSTAGALGYTVGTISFTITAGASPMANGDTFVFSVFYQQSGDTAFEAVNGGTSAGSDSFYPTEFDFSHDWKAKAVPGPQRFGNPPVIEDQPEMKVSFSIPQFEGNANDINGANVVRDLYRDMQYQQNGIVYYYKIDCYFELYELAGATTKKYSMRFMFPRVALSLPDFGISGPGLEPVKISGEVLQPFAIPTDFSTVATPGNAMWPWAITITNKNSAA